MGLDMYLSKRHYVKNWEHDTPERKYEIKITRGGKSVDKSEINTNKIEYLIEEAGYWRKANAIHKWFVDNVQKGEDDCKEYYVSQGKMENLLDLVIRVLANHSLAEELLPTESGFFFGSTDYDEYYFKDLELTRQILIDALADGTRDFYYKSSW